MDSTKIGALLRQLRLERGLTQKQVADLLCVSDKAISKWERGNGCPDVSLLCRLAEIFNVQVESVLHGNLDVCRTTGGNMKRLKHYLCPDCGNVLTSTGEGALSCCGRSLAPLTPQVPDEAHQIKIEEIENDFYITFPHPMTKTHYLTFMAYASYNKLLLVKLYPEQGGEVRFPRMYGGKIYYCCNQDGLWVFDPDAKN